MEEQEIYTDRKVTWKETYWRNNEKIQRINQLNAIIGRRSNFQKTKKTIYEASVRTIITYRARIMRLAAGDLINKLEKVQNNTFRRITDARWYMRNTQLRRDLKRNTINEKINKRTKKKITRMEDHMNTLVKAATKYNENFQWS